VRSLATSGNRSGSGISQSMQRNLRPPVFTSIKCIGLLHFGQVGGGEFLGMGYSRNRREYDRTLCHRYAGKGSVISVAYVNDEAAVCTIPDSAGDNYSFRMIISAASLASRSDAESSGVTVLEIVLPFIKVAGCRIGVNAARQYPGRRS
jgi:hypothetical protein